MIKDSEQDPEHEKFVKVEEDNIDIIIDMLKSRKAKVRTNAYQTTEEHVRLINSQISFIMMLKPQVNQKWKRHWLQWVTIIRNFKAQSPHFASKQSAILTGLLFQLFPFGIVRILQCN